MEHPISEVARLAGVSSRTLRHYDDLGLLRPARVSTNGYRWYGRAELQRLQRILLLREQRVPLGRIGAILDGTEDERVALRRHREELLDERARLDRIIATVDRTLTELAGGPPQDDADFFDGLAERKAGLRERLVERYGDGVDAHFASAEQATAEWSRDDHERAAAAGRELHDRMSRARARGVAPDDEEALDLVAEHYAGVRAMWPADAAAYAALGNLVLDDPDQRAIVGAADEDLPAWLSRAIAAFVVRRLEGRVHE